MTVRTKDNKVTKVLVMMDRVLRGIKGDDQGAEDRKEVEPKVLTNQLVKIARQMLEESEARNKMELQLRNMQKLLEKLVNNQTSQAELSVTTTTPTVTTPAMISTTSTIGTQPSVSDLTLGKCSVV